ncbi:MAG: tRNA (adenosine(37)-N6)-threonylcarbamoyltransferase complex dimerization subunit type 1 TsaB [Bdellovibrionales bacterium]|jgi:tRNA threonylcarbamoyladenosine biosynthesis protein TsaB|nr:tRNA (adenosine(37)-N6)-threonylcarbamoyltransferase complex dimerization subunit type 1 TsaB [Bdellovibrionales bacterium]
MPQETAFLSIETCTAAGSVAVLRSPDTPTEKVIAHNAWVRSRSHAEAMTPAMEDAVKIAGGWSAINAIAVGIGPGSFTGIRVGLNAARTAAWSLGLPLIGIRSTDAILEGARASGLVPNDHLILAALNAQMGLYFAAWTDSQTSPASSTEPAAFTPEALIAQLGMMKAKKTICLLGEAADDLLPQLKSSGLSVTRPASDLDSPHALTIARLAARTLAQGLATSPSTIDRMFSWQSVQPLYIRGSGAEEKLR